jgi:hypothetical protein
MGLVGALASVTMIVHDVMGSPVSGVLKTNDDGAAFA